MKILFFLFLIWSVRSMDNGVARTPPMGWLAWERFRCVIDCKTFPDTCIGEKLFYEQGQRLAEDGWVDVGYTLVNIDDCWSNKTRNGTGFLQPNKDRFPHGIGPLAAKMHEYGLQMGIYGDMGTHTCGGYPGSMGFEKKDADLFASWGIDMLKYDGCYSNETQQEVGYPAMSVALNDTGRPMVYSCSWPAYQGGLPPKVNYTELGEICNLWRNYGDIQDSWDDVIDIINWWGDNQDVLIPAAGPGKWNDPDMLIGGNFALSVSQAQVQFGIWAMLAAPLFLSVDLRTIDPEFVKVLQNTAVIAVDQDAMGIQGRRYLNGGKGEQLPPDTSVWSRPLVHEEYALAVISFRTNGAETRLHFTLKQVGFKDIGHTGAYMCADIYDPNHKTFTWSMDEAIYLYINPDSIFMYRCFPMYFHFPDNNNKINKQTNNQNDVL